MRINISIIKDDCERVFPIESWNNCDNKKVKRCELLCKDRSILTEDILYISTDSCQSTDFSVVCIDPAKTDPYKMRNHINDFIESVEEWKDKIYCSVMQGNGLNEIISICSEPFSNPIALFDAYSVLLAYAGAFIKEKDVVWDLVIEEGYFPIERFRSLDEKLVMFSNDTVIGKMPGHDTTMAGIPLKHNNEPVAIICATDVNVSFTEGQLSLLKLLKDILENTGIIEEINLKDSQNSGIVIDRMLRGVPTEANVTSYFLKNWGYKMTDTFQLRYLYRDTSGVNDDDDNKALVHRIARVIPRAVIYVIDNGIALLTGTELRVEQYESLCQIMDKYDMRCAVSTEFSPFTYLRYAYLQCRYMVMISDRYKEKEMLFEDNYENLIIESISNSVSLKALCDASILKMSETKQGVTFIKSLKTYLMNGGNISIAARKLYLHRNTLIYRIEKMEELLKTDFHNLSDSEQLRYIISCIISERIGTNQAIS